MVILHSYKALPETVGFFFVLKNGIMNYCKVFNGGVLRLFACDMQFLASFCQREACNFVLQSLELLAYT